MAREAAGTEEPKVGEYEAWIESELAAGRWPGQIIQDDDEEEKEE